MTEVLQYFCMQRNLVFTIAVLQLLAECLGWKSILGHPLSRLIVRGGCDQYQTYSFRSTGQYTCIRRWPASCVRLGSSKEENFAPKLDYNEDYYCVLEVSEKASPQELKKAYYKIVFKYHPDNKEGESAKLLANQQMMVINAAYKVLKTESTRAEYDRKRSMGMKGAASRVKEKAVKSEDGESRYRTTSQSSGKASSSASSSSRASASETFSSNGFNAGNRYGSFNPEGGESLKDIVSELWQDVTKNSGNNLFEDFLDYLEIKDDPGKMNFAGVYASTASSFNEAAIISLREKLRTAKEDRDNLLARKQEKERYLSQTKDSIKTQSGVLKEDEILRIERRLRDIEDLKKLEAKILEVEKQVLSVELKLLKKMRETKSTDSNYEYDRQSYEDWISPSPTANSFSTPNPSSSRDAGSGPNSSNRQPRVPPNSGASESRRAGGIPVVDPVEDELRKLKKKLGK